MSGKIKSVIKTAAVMILCLVLCIVIGAAALIGVYSIPTARVKEHMVTSSETMYNEGRYAQIVSWSTDIADSFTDALMLNNAAYSSEDPVHDAMIVPRETFSDNGDSFPEGDLWYRYLGGEEPDSIQEYSRYWHGYLLFLKPLLLLTDYSGVRTVNGILYILLALAASYLMWKRKIAWVIPAYLVALVTLNPVMNAKCLQYADCYYILNIGIIAVLLLRGKPAFERYVPFIFMLLGVCTAYFDYLTYPSVTFCFPAVIYFTVRGKYSDIKGNLLRFLVLGICWCFGYGVMWAGKWIMASLLTDKNVIAEGLSSVRVRAAGSQDNGEKYRFADVIKQNWKYFCTWYTEAGAIIGAAAFLAAAVIKAGKLHIGIGRLLAFSVPFWLVALVPFAWQAVVRNHSGVHFFLVSKVFAGTVFAGLCGFGMIASRTKGELSQYRKRKKW